jgi:glutathione peroxidase
VIDLTMKRLDGGEQALSEYQGKVLLLVNVASKCGLTPQYEALETLHETYGERGFSVIGFPANDFRGQEPGTDEEIAEFCSATYGVQFPMFSKVVVTGEEKHPLYQYLTTLPEPVGGEVTWNFQKYLVDREGNVVKMFSPRITPDDPEVVGAIESLL